MRNVEIFYGRKPFSLNTVSFLDVSSIYHNSSFSTSQKTAETELSEMMKWYEGEEINLQRIEFAILDIGCGEGWYIVR